MWCNNKAGTYHANTYANCLCIHSSAFPFIAKLMSIVVFETTFFIEHGFPLVAVPADGRAADKLFRLLFTFCEPVDERFGQLNPALFQHLFTPSCPADIGYWRTSKVDH